MELKRATKKIPSEQNLRLLSSLILSISAKQGALEDRCIAPWKSGETYQANISYVSNLGYIWLCKTTNNDVDFSESKWIKMADNITELSKDDISALINLSPQEISKLSDIISTEIRLDKTFSSSDTYTRIQAAIDTAKEYTNNQLGKAVKPAYKVVSSTSEVTETGYFYLISNGTNYDMYVLGADGQVVSLGTSEVDLSNYYTKTEVDNDFLKKSDAASTYATITTVDGKVDKTNILSTLDSSATDDQVYSAKVVNTELDKKANNDDVVKKTDVSTTINNRSTNDTVPTSLAVRNAILGMGVTDNTTYGDDILYFPCGIYKIVNNATAATLKNLPISSAGLLQVYSINSHNSDLLTGTYTYRMYVFIPIGKRDMYVRNIDSGNTAGVFTTDTGWKRLCTTSVSDVPVTNITTNLVSTKVALDNSDSYATYYVKSGTCYVTIWSLRLIEACSVETIFNGLPKSTIGVTCPLCNGVESFAQVFMSPNSGVIAFNANASLVNKSGYCSFSYPVAES